MAKFKKTPRPKAITPKGFRDYFGADVAERKSMLDAIAQVYHLYGFEALESSAVETVEALGKFLPDVDRPNEGVFAWQEDEDWLALRYDLTAPLARVYAQYQNDLPKPYRRFAMGPVWRNEKPGPGRFRQFYQCDADTVGTASVAADAEICMMLADALEAVGIERGDYVIRVNNRKVLNGVLEVAGIAEDDERTRGIVLRAIDKLDRLGPDGVRALLGAGRKDESGDFTDGAGLSPGQVETLLSFADWETEKAKIISSGIQSSAITRSDDWGKWKNLAAVDELELDPENNKETFQLRNEIALYHLFGLVQASEVGDEGVRELGNIADLCTAQGYGPDRIVIDPSVVRGLGYYTGPVFEAELTFEIKDEKGRPRQFGSVAGGGRYDDLVKRFTGQAVPATGISIGVDRLLAALRAKGRIDGATDGPVVVTVMDKDRLAEYQKMASELRQAGIRAEVYLGNPKNFGNQMKYADKRGSKVAIIQGSDEAERGVVQLKDLVLGAKIAETATHEEWKDQPAQFEVPREDLVAQGARDPGAMTPKSDIKAEAERLRAALEARGAIPFEADILQPAGALLDLYGEDIRARAFVTHDPVRGEMMLRPDFTVPLVQAHAASGAGASRYAYAGEVFRRQEEDTDRAAEYLQVGFEVFGRAAAEADAEVFATFADLLAPLGLRAAIGDIGLLRAAIEGLPVGEGRKALLLHHLWRPRRFKALLTRMGETSSRAVPKPPAADAVEIGLRTRAEVVSRLDAMTAEQSETPLSAEAIALIDALLAVRETAPNALQQLEDIAVDLPSINGAVDLMSARFDALSARGVDVQSLGFEASYGRTSLEYYDGFVFGFYADTRPDLPPIATGGRYDALTRVLGGADATPAIGGVIRPGLMAEVGA